jgi:hypothetical protein
MVGLSFLNQRKPFVTGNSTKVNFLIIDVKGMERQLQLTFLLN